MTQGRHNAQALLAVALGLAVPSCRAAAQGPLPLDSIKLPPGFRIAVYAHPVRDARSLALGERGTVFVGTREAGAVYALVDRDGDKRADEVLTLARGLDMPNGVAFRQGALYVAEVSRILRFDRIESRLRNPPAPAVVRNDLPREHHHGWKFIAFGPDGLLYVPVGAPCNICEPSDPHAAILRMHADGSGQEIVARGVRNTVGFDWQPGTSTLYFTDNGRDLMGDDVPPDELNRLSRAGEHFGYPYCHGGDISDPQFGTRRPCADFTPPVMKLGPHVAALGMRFYTGSMFPADYRNHILIAEHGSWNRSQKIGYRVMLVRAKDGRAISYEPFAQGWLRGERAWGRPVDLMALPDGSLLLSDDEAGAVYRITYEGR